jgi:hypothetical protein
MDDRLIQWLNGLREVKQKIDNDLLPIADEHSLEAPNVVINLEALTDQIAHYFDRFKVQLVPKGPSDCACRGWGCPQCDDDLYERAQEALQEERRERRRNYAEGYEAGYNDGTE